MQFNYQQFLNQEQQNNTLLINPYYNSQDYKLLVIYGQEIIFKTFNRLLQLLKTFLSDEKESKKQLILNLFIGIGIPIMIILILLSALQMILLKQMVRRIMLSLTFLPTFKFQDKIVLFLIKAILKI
ncbi:unnamed protein product [Paramecium primaurelia]|uniref:Transmembrane protein n=1 Tax=Paramecium primaurelia TaxID=5886 RepID=A0A8S1KKM4_PARPR|nr:unnamed protein product [Paramecium primaurelia]